MLGEEGRRGGGWKGFPVWAARNLKTLKSEGVEVLEGEGGKREEYVCVCVRGISGWREKMCVRADVHAMCSFTNQSMIWRPRFVN